MDMDRVENGKIVWRSHCRFVTLRYSICQKITATKTSRKRHNSGTAECAKLIQHNGTGETLIDCHNGRLIQPVHFDSMDSIEAPQTDTRDTHCASRISICSTVENQCKVETFKKHFCDKKKCLFKNQCAQQVKIFAWKSGREKREK
jgi:hypothetical protein